MKYIWLFLNIIFLGISGNAQQAVHPGSNKYHKNIYAEFLGSHFLLGVNFDMRFKKNQLDGIGFRAGIGGFHASQTGNLNNYELNMLTFPIEFNHLIGKNRSS